MNAVAHDVRRPEPRGTGIAELSGQEAERLGCELHDGAAQDLAAAICLLESLKPDIERLDAGLHARLREIDSLLVDCQGRIRRLARKQLCVEPYAEDLPDLLRALARWITKTFNIECRLRNTAPPRELDRETKACLYHVAREAALNAARHARAHRIALRLAVSPGGGLRLTVRDDGRGFDPGLEASRDGMGLRSMRCRAERIGAVLRIRSAPGKGAGVSIERPSALPGKAQ